MAAAAPAAENVRSLNIPADGRMSTRRPAFTEGTLCVLDCELHSLFLITRPEIELHQQKSTNSPPKNDRPVRIEQQSFLLMERLEMGPQQPTEMEILPEDKNPARNPGGWFCKDPEGDAENLQAACVRVPGVEPGEIRQYSGIFNFDFRVSSGRCTLRYVIILCGQPLMTCKKTPRQSMFASSCLRSHGGAQRVQQKLVPKSRAGWKLATTANQP